MLMYMMMMKGKTKGILHVVISNISEVVGLKRNQTSLTHFFFFFGIGGPSRLYRGLYILSIALFVVSIDRFIST